MENLQGIFFLRDSVLGRWTLVWGVVEKEPQLRMLFPCPPGHC